MTIHNWTADGYELGGEWYGTKTCLQNFRCRNCGIKGVRPDDGSLPDVSGCTGLVARPKIARPNPLEGRDDNNPVEKHDKHYQQHQKGKRN